LSLLPPPQLNLEQAGRQLLAPRTPLLLLPPPLLLPLGLVMVALVDPAIPWAISKGAC
jgi:hypothetical protein